jgi:hypothetical protein
MRTTSHAGFDGRHGVLDQHLERGAADVGLIEVLRADPEILREHHRAHGEEPDRGVAVHVGEGKAGVGQGPLGGLGVDLELREVGEMGVVRGRHACDDGPASHGRRD